MPTCHRSKRASKSPTRTASRLWGRAENRLPKPCLRLVKQPVTPILPTQIHVRRSNLQGGNDLIIITEVICAGSDCYVRFAVFPMRSGHSVCPRFRDISKERVLRFLIPLKAYQFKRSKQRFPIDEGYRVHLSYGALHLEPWRSERALPVPYGSCRRHRAFLQWHPRLGSRWR